MRHPLLPLTLLLLLVSTQPGIARPAAPGASAPTDSIAPAETSAPAPTDTAAPAEGDAPTTADPTPSPAGPHTDRVYNNLVTRTDRGWNFNFLGISTADEAAPDGHSHHTTCHLGPETAYLGLNGLADTDLDLREANSLEAGLSLASLRIENRRRTFGLECQLMLSLSNYRLGGHRLLTLDADGRTVCTPIDPTADLQRPRLKYNSWRAPVMLTWRGPRGRYGMAVGMEAELRHHIRSRAKHGHTRRLDVVRNDLGVHPWGCNAVVAFRYKDVALFGRWTTTDFFDSSRTDLRGTPFMIGFALLNLDD